MWNRQGAYIIVIFFLIQDISLAFVKVASKAVQSEKYEPQVNDGAAYFRRRKIRPSKSKRFSHLEVLISDHYKINKQLRDFHKEDFNMLFLQITTFSVIVTLLLLLILSMHKRNSTSLAFILQKMGKDFCDFFETTTTPAYLPLSFFFFFVFWDLCDPTRKCWILCTVIIHLMSQAHRSTVCCSRFKPLCIIKMPLATHSSCKLFLVSHLLSNISFWQCVVGSPQKSPNKVFSCRNTFFFLLLLAFHSRSCGPSFF